MRKERSAVLIFVVALIAVMVGIQFLYTYGQVYHALILAYKGGGWVTHMITFGRSGVLFYMVIAFAIIISLWKIIIYRGGFGKAKIATSLLLLSLLADFAFFCLIVMPYSDIVSRS